MVHRNVSLLRQLHQKTLVIFTVNITFHCYINTINTLIIFKMLHRFGNEVKILVDILMLFNSIENRSLYGRIKWMNLASKNETNSSLNRKHNKIHRYDRENNIFIYFPGKFNKYRRPIPFLIYLYV